MLIDWWCREKVEESRDSLLRAVETPAEWISAYSRWCELWSYEYGEVTWCEILVHRDDNDDSNVAATLFEAASSDR